MDALADVWLWYHFSIKQLIIELALPFIW